ncbi:MAG: hypothetical protein PHV05_07445 [Candidatus Riflebacteria bacterium]|nr:hypothetical protein [Candidatus Riflebacteria bacterium]
MNYYYWVKRPDFRNILDLRNYRKEIRQALMTVRGIETDSIAITEKFFTFKTSCILTTPEKQAMGRQISKNSSALREYITLYVKKVDEKIVISKCLFRHMPDAQINRIEIV